MDNFDGIDEQVFKSPVGSKRIRNTASYSRNKAKNVRNSGEGKTPSIACVHNLPGVCVAARMKEILYSTCDKVQQDALLLSYMDIRNVNRRRQRVDDQNKRKQRNYTVKYFALKANSRKVPVCKASFIGISCKYFFDKLFLYKLCDNSEQNFFWRVLFLCLSTISIICNTNKSVRSLINWC